MDKIDLSAGITLGRHLLLELYGCKSELLNDISQIKTHLVEAALAVGATVVEQSFHQFSPYGVSGVVVIAESHLTIHTWPEHHYAAIDAFTCDEDIHYAAIDAFTCDEDINMQKIQDFLVQAFSADSFKSALVRRGLPDAQPVTA